MSDKINLEKFLKNFVAGEKEAAAQYLSQVITSKTRKLVNEGSKEEKKSADDKEEGTSEKEMDKSKPAVKDKNAGKKGKSGEEPTSEKEMDKSKPNLKDGKVGDTEEKDMKKVSAPKGKLNTTKEE